MANDDRTGFHELDDALHEILCDIAGRPKVWTIIKDNKAHMDRVRYLSLGKGSQLAYDDHCALLVTIKARDIEAASTLMRAHLERIGHIIDDIRAEHGEFFLKMRTNVAHKKLLTIGECMVEMAPDGAGKYDMNFAGDTLNTAWYARRCLAGDLDYHVGYMTCAGADAVSDRMVTFLQSSGIETDHIARIPDRTVGLT